MLTARTTLAFLGAWLVPLAVHVAGADALLPPLILAVLIMVSRGGTTLLDRVVVALGLLAGATCAAGLVISWWPWRMHPVPVAGFALTVLVAIGWRRGMWGSGRRPWWPRLGDRRDALVVAGWLGVTALAAAPFVTRDVGGRLGVVAPGEDMARHFVIFDAIHQLGRYAFMDLAAAHRFTSDDSMLSYPQGTHFLYALLGRLFGVDSSGIAGMSWLIWCLLGTFSFLVLAVLWGVRRLAGPGATPVALLLVLLPVSALLIFGDPVAVLFRGYPNELLGLALTAILVAVLARPLHRLGEQVACVVALVVGVSFTYYLFLGVAAFGALAWALARRRALLRRWPLLVFALVAAPLVLVTPLSIPEANTGNQLLIKGTALQVDRPVAVLLVVVAALGLLLRRGLRSPARRMTLVTFGLALGTVGVLGAYQLVSVGHTVYYFEKALHLLLVVALVAVGAAVRLVPPLGPARRLVPALAASALVCGMLVGLGGPNHTRAGTYGMRIVLGVDHGSPDGGRGAVFIARTQPDPSGPVVVDLRHSPWGNFFSTMYGAALRRDYGGALAWLGQLWPPGPPATLADLEALVETSPRPVRLLVGGAQVHSLAGVGGPSDAELARALQVKYPGKVLIG